MGVDFDFRKIKKKNTSADPHGSGRFVPENTRDLLKKTTETLQKAVSAYEEYEKRHKATLEALQDRGKADIFLQETTYDDIRAVIQIEGDGIPKEYTSRIREAFRGGDLEARRNVLYKDFTIFEAVPLYEAYCERIRRAQYIVETKTGQLQFNIEQLKRPIAPKVTALNNTKVYNQIVTLATVPGRHEVTVNSQKSKNHVTTVIDISQLEEDMEIYGGKLTKIDLLNLKAVHDLYEAGNETMTADQVYRQRKGYRGAEKVNPSSTKATRRSLQKMSRIKITIDYARHIKMINPDMNTSGVKFKRTRALLPMDEVQVLAGGVETWAFRLMKPISKRDEDPILLYQYAKDVNQIIYLPAELLNIKDTIQRSTDYDDILKDYLLRQITWMKQPGTKRSNNITYESTYAEIYGESTITRKQKAATRAKTRDILYSFQIKKFIVGYEEYPAGKHIVTGINIVI